MPGKSMHLYESAPKPEPQKKTRKLDGALLIIIFLLLAVGLIALYTASYPTAYYRFKGNGSLFAFKQAKFALGGIAAMLFVAHVIDYHIYGRWQKPLIVLAFILLALVVYTPLGIEHNNATRWLGHGGFEFQPSEVMKFAVIVSFSYYATRAGDKIRTFRHGLLPFLCCLVAVGFLLYKQPHLSATIIIFGTGLAILFTAGIKLWYFVPVGIIGVSGFAAAYVLMNHVRERINVWLDPFVDYLDSGWQGANSQIAIGSGGFWGLGLGQGRQKYLYLPEPQNDFVFSAWCEETGFIGALLVMALFIFLIWRGFYIARHARDEFGCLLAVGITTKLAIQTLVNLFVVTGIFPVTGASLPFFSYGGTALLIELCEMGVLLNISKNMKRDE